MHHKVVRVEDAEDFSLLLPHSSHLYVPEDN